MPSRCTCSGMDVGGSGVECVPADRSPCVFSRFWSSRLLPHRITSPHLAEQSLEKATWSIELSIYASATPHRPYRAKSSIKELPPIPA
jgi:hypothetical protein